MWRSPIALLDLACTTSVFLNKNAMKPLYSMLHTGNFVYDNEVRNSLISLGMENKEAYSLVYYDNTCDVYDAGAAEEVAEQDSGNM